MFGSESDFDKQSGLLCNGKRYKNTDYTPLSPKEFEFGETPFVRNPLITPQRRSVIPEKPL